ncbi:unnamed protein product [Bemisia tabaci]|uniref:PPM-type phosphatase domain-containing protein n=3 Tax=Bemisia tabaci TaxID=7038 RepID=A0A9P0ADS0_BEMTA|nr:unnamed protein product [Bemisia tabaci]
MRKMSIIEEDSLEASENEKCSEKQVNLSGAGLEYLPEDLVSRWMHAEELVLSNNRLSATESNLDLLQRLPNLRRLSLSGTSLREVPPVLQNLDKLQVLDLSNNKLKYAPRQLEGCARLKELRLDHNELYEINADEKAFPRLEILSASHNKLSSFPKILRKFSTMRTTPNSMPENGTSNHDKEQNTDPEHVNVNHLTQVFLRANQLKGNIILGNYGNLTQLDVSENAIECLDLSALDKLENIQCSKNILKNLAINGRNLVSLIAGNNRLRRLTVTNRPTKLQHLDVSYNELDELPDWVGDCPHLATLFASNNRLSSLPAYLFCGEMRSLETLQLSFNQLTSLPVVVREIPLQQLFLQSNSITALPQHFFSASSRLRVLNVSKNCLKELPLFSGENYVLERLYLTSNALTDITSLTNCINLRTIHAAYNAISILPDLCIVAWRELEELVMSGNSLCSLPENLGQLPHLRILRVHSNFLTSCPNFAQSRSLRVLDISYNELNRINLKTLIPPQLQFLDLSGNSRLHVDLKQFQSYRSQRAMSLVDVSGQNRSVLPSSPPYQEVENANLETPWVLGFSETSGQRDRLCVSQLRMGAFCNHEVLAGIFDANINNEISQYLVKIIPRILLEERTVKETASEYMKYTMLSAHKELKEKGQKTGVCAVLCHIVRQKCSGSTKRYVLRIASVGEARAILCRTSGCITLTPSNRQPTVRSQLGASSLFPHSLPDPHVVEIPLHDQDECLLLANKQLWEVISVEEAMAEVRSVRNPVLAAKRLQDLAQSYGCEDNISVIVLRFHGLLSEHDLLISELRSTLRRSNDTDGFYVTDCTIPHVVLNDFDRSSPSGQSDHTSSGKATVYNGDVHLHHPSSYHTDKMRPFPNYQSILLNEPRPRSRQIKPMDNSLAELSDEDIDDSGSASTKSDDQLSEERFRCWEYMLEQNTQMLFDKELNTLSRGFMKRPGPSRPSLWPARAKSVSHLPDTHANSTTPQPTPFLRHFGSARSFQPLGNLVPTRKLSGGPNAAYFGSLQRLMPCQLDYDFARMRERHALNSVDSLEHDHEGRMSKYWDVTTTEL